MVNVPAEVPWCTVFCVTLALISHTCVLIGNLETSSALASIGKSTGGWSKVGVGIGRAFKEELDVEMTKVTTKLTEALEHISEVTEGLDSLVSMVGGTAENSTKEAQLVFMQQSSTIRRMHSRGVEVQSPPPLPPVPPVPPAAAAVAETTLPPRPPGTPPADTTATTLPPLPPADTTATTLPPTPPAVAGTTLPPLPPNPPPTQASANTTVPPAAAESATTVSPPEAATTTAEAASATTVAVTNDTVAAATTEAPTVASTTAETTPEAATTTAEPATTTTEAASATTVAVTNDTVAAATTEAPTAETTTEAATTTEATTTEATTTEATTTEATTTEATTTQTKFPLEDNLKVEKNITEAIDDLVDELGDELNKFVKKFVNAKIQATLDKAVNLVVSKLEMFLQKLNPVLKKVGEWLVKFGDKILSALEGFSGTLDNVQKIFDKVMGALSKGKPDGITQKMVHDTFTLMDLGNIGYVRQIDLENIGKMYGIDALQGTKPAELVKKYDSNNDTALDQAEYTLAMQDDSITGAMDVVLRAYSKKLSEVAGRVGKAKMRDELSAAVVNYLQLVCAKNQTKMSWVSQMLTNETLPIEFTADVMIQLALAQDDKNVLTTADVGQMVITEFLRLNPEYSVKAYDRLTNQTFFTEEGFDPADYSTVVKRVTTWLHKAQDDLESPRLIEDQDDQDMQDLVDEILSELPGMAHEQAELSMASHFRKRRKEKHQRQVVYFTSSANFLLHHLSGGSVAKKAPVATSAAEKAIKSGVPAKPVTLKFAQWLAWNGTDTSAIFQKQCFDDSSSSSSPLDSFGSDIAGLTKKITSFLKMMETWTQPGYIETIVKSFAENVEEDVLKVVDRLIDSTLKKVEDPLIKGMKSKLGDHLPEGGKVTSIFDNSNNSMIPKTITIDFTGAAKKTKPTAAPTDVAADKKAQKTTKAEINTDAAPTPVEFTSKVGRAACPPENTIENSVGYTDEKSVQDRCDQLRCVSYAWSDDDNDNKGSAWFCNTDQYDAADTEFPRWKVGRSPQADERAAAHSNPTDLAYISKVGRAACPPDNTMENSIGYADEKSVQDRCDKLKCVSYAWSNDDNDNKGSAWFCSTDQYDTVDNGAEFPSWKVGRSPQAQKGPAFIQETRELKLAANKACHKLGSRSHFEHMQFSQVEMQTIDADIEFGATLSGFWEKIVTVLHSLNNMLPQAAIVLKEARVTVSGAAEQMGSVFETFETKGPTIFDTIAELWSTLWVLYFCFFFPLTALLLFYGFWASGWFGGPKQIEALPEELVSAAEQGAWWAKARVCCRSCCNCMHTFHDTAMCFWSVIILMEVVCLLIFVISIVLNIFAGVKALIVNGCSQVYMLNDPQICLQTLDLFKGFLKSFHLEHVGEDLSNACIQHSLLTCDAVIAKMKSSMFLTTVFSFVAAIISFQMIIESSILHERARWRRILDAMEGDGDEKDQD